MKEVEIYTDGACSGNPGPGGWGAVLMCNGKNKEISGFEKETTNNRMEIMASIAALESLKETVKVKLYTDSAYLSNAFNQKWIDKWKTNGWKNSKKATVESLELWQRLLKMTEKHDVTFIKVKGHSDNKWNNRCDFLATEEVRKNAKYS